MAGFCACAVTYLSCNCHPYYYLSLYFFHFVENILIYLYNNSQSIVAVLIFHIVQLLHSVKDHIPLDLKIEEKLYLFQLLFPISLVLVTMMLDSVLTTTLIHYKVSSCYSKTLLLTLQMMDVLSAMFLQVTFSIHQQLHHKTTL